VGIPAGHDVQQCVCVCVFLLQAVDVKKLQGTLMHVSTERGPLKVKAIYAESTSVSSSSGTVELGHVHGEAERTTTVPRSLKVDIEKSTASLCRISSQALFKVTQKCC
jgi:hypothetical protein